MGPVQHVAEERAKKAADAYVEARRKWEQQQQRLQQLRNFRDEYQDQRTASGGTGMDAFRLRDYNAFIARIDVAIEQQLQTITKTEQEVQRLRQIWIEKRGHSKAIDKVVVRYQDDERRDEERKAQKQSDERAQRSRAGRSPAEDD
jgi:flagellar FliJ protein